MWFDLFLIIMVLGGLALGAWKGLTWQFAGIASIVLGFVLGSPLAAAVAGYFEAPGTLTLILIFAVSYAAIALACHLAALLVRALLKKMELDGWDRHLGAMAGATQAFILCAVIAMILTSVAPSTLEGSSVTLLEPAMDGVKEVMIDLLPEEVTSFLAHEKPATTPSLN